MVGVVVVAVMVVVVGVSGGSGGGSSSSGSSSGVLFEFYLSQSVRCFLRRTVAWQCWPSPVL